ncbi:LysR family transcriptional regulator [Ruegeria lacuscaerulensis]|uniref:LysR family transcriptional regulator n=1 Tax=Ruegeria lacuscaerulensis TaxID=55218 RepID=UPI001480AE3C|nr:LysR family transcriptional regulator [Ruegeria lacuscaerulensis]
MLYLSLRQYEYVCAIGRHGGLSAAAQYLNVSQPALSNALTRVEEQVGHPLFTRKRGAAMSLTPQGRRFIEQAEALLARAAQLENASAEGPAAARLRLGCFEDLAPFLLARSLRLLRRELPDVAVTYRVADFQGLVSGLVQGEIDLAFTYGLTLDAGFSTTQLFANSPNAVMSPDHPLAGREHVSLSDVAAYPLILSDEGLSAQHFLNLFRSAGQTPKVAHRAASLEIQRSFAAHEEGVAMTYANIPAPLSYDGTPLVSLPVTDQIAREPVVLARHGTGPLDALTERAQQVLAELST